MQIRIDRIKIDHFKGFESFELRLDGKNAQVYGDNGTGKTSIYDAFLWCLFDKDSSGRTAFEIKPLQADGKPVHLLESVVELELKIDNEPLSLKKLYKEKWVKKRGDAEESFSGHETLYWVNEVPVKASEYRAKIAERIDEATFRRITSPEFFVAQGSKEMRKALIDMIGDLSDQQIAGDDIQLQLVVDLMQKKGYSPDDLAKVVRQKISEANREIRSIPDRIDEVRRGMPECEEWQLLEAERNQLVKEIEKIEKTLASARDTAKSFRDKQEKVNSLYRDLTALKRQLATEANEQADQYQTKVNEYRKKIAHCERTMVAHDEQIDRLSSELDRLNKVIEAERKAYLYEQEVQAEIKQKIWSGLDPAQENCPVCGQRLPEEKIEKLIARAKAAFEADVRNQLQQSVNRANQHARSGSNSKKLIDRYMSEREKLIQEKELLVTDLEQLKTELQELEAEPVCEVSPDDFNDHPEVVVIRRKIGELESKLNEPDSCVTELISRKTELGHLVRTIDSRIAKRDQIVSAEKRIDELHERNRELSSLIAEQEGIKYAVELFVRTKAEMLESSINELFEYIQFRLFKQNINGGIEDDCEPLINGVPYWTGASNSERIRAGLDIIRTLQKHSGIYAPVFVDNAESATWLLPMDCQVIQLIVSERDKELRIEIEQAA